MTNGHGGEGWQWRGNIVEAKKEQHSVIESHTGRKWRARPSGGKRRQRHGNKESVRKQLESFSTMNHPPFEVDRSGSSP